MKVFITGGTGFLGGRVARVLAAEGCSLAALVRDPQRGGGRLPAGTRLVQGDVTDAASLRRGMEGAEAVVHMAAMVKRWAKDRSVFDAVNIGGLRNVLDAARASGVRTVLYTSSFIAIGPTDGRTIDESWVPRERAYFNDYERTKFEADRVARRAAEEGYPLIVVYPGVIYGSGELTDGNIIGQVGQKYVRKKLPAIVGPGDRRQCFAVVDDVARGHWLALTKGAPGSRYILGGENRTTQELLRVMESVTGIPAPKRRLPYWLASAAGRLMRLRADLTGAEPELTDEEVNIYRHEWAYSSQRAISELGYTMTPFETGVGALMRWLLDLEAGKASA